MKKEYFTLEDHVDVEMDISMQDIIENLYHFSEKEIDKLRKSININGNNFLNVNNLNDQQKVEILKELFDKCSIFDLEKIKNEYLK